VYHISQHMLQTTPPAKPLTIAQLAHSSTKRLACQSHR